VPLVALLEALFLAWDMQISQPMPSRRARRLSMLAKMLSRCAFTLTLLPVNMWFTFCYQVREDSASKREEALAAAEAATKDKKAA